MTPEQEKKLNDVVHTVEQLKLHLNTEKERSDKQQESIDELISLIKEDRQKA